MEDENIIDREDISVGETNEETMSGISTVNSKEDEDIVIDKVIEENNNIREVLAIPKESLSNEVKEIVNIIEADRKSVV